MDDFLLFVHVLSAFVLIASVVVYTGVAAGVPASPSVVRTSEALWGIGVMGTLIFGIWIALKQDAYGIFDGWIIGALLLWAAATETGRRSTVAAKDGNIAAMVPWHALRAGIVLALLVVMIYKPGA
jgi:hypothetical protein